MIAAKHSKEALAFWTLYKSMKPEVEQEVRDMIISDAAKAGNTDFTADMMTDLSLQSFAEFWESQQDEKWNDFIKSRLNV